MCLIFIYSHVAQRKALFLKQLGHDVMLEDTVYLESWAERVDHGVIGLCCLLS